MKTQRKLLVLKKIQVAKINSFSIIGKGNSILPCTIIPSRTPKGGRTQTFTNEIDCEITTTVI
jgi:hypothetical protein